MIKCIFEDGGEGALRHVVVDAILLHEGKVVLVRRAAHLREGGKLALPGGYSDRNETINQTVLREVYEESGFEAEIKYLLTISDNPSRKNDDRQNVSFVYVMEATAKSADPDGEVSEVLFFDVDHLPAEEEFAFDHFHLLDVYRRYIQHPEQYTLPIFGAMSFSKASGE